MLVDDASMLDRMQGDGAFYVVNPEENSEIADSQLAEAREIFWHVPKCLAGALRMGGRPADFSVDPSPDGRVEL